MKIHLLKVKKSFKKENFTINPNAYWRGLIVLAFIAVFVGFSFSFSIFKEINLEPNSFSDSAVEKSELTRKEKVEKILEYFALREARSKEIINSEAPIIDPSL